MLSAPDIPNNAMAEHASGGTVLTMVCVLMGLAVVVVACRMYARLYIARKATLDDWTILAALTIAGGLTAAMITQVHCGLGSRDSNLSTQANPSLLQAFWFSILTYHLSIGLARLSVVLQCMHIFPQASFGIAKWLVRSLLVLDIINTLWSFFSSLFLCWPVEKSWYPETPGRCFKRIVIWLINSTTAMLLDFAVAAMALPWIRHLRLPMRQKVLLGGVFVLAGFPCVLAVIRLQALVQVATSAGSPYTDSILGIFSASEVYVAIICACLPNLKVLYTQARPRLADSDSWICRYLPTSSCSGSSGGSILKVPDVMKWAQRRWNSRSSSTPRNRPSEQPINIADGPGHQMGDADIVAPRADQAVKRPARAVVKDGNQHIERMASPQPHIGILSSLQTIDDAVESQPSGRAGERMIRLGVLSSAGSDA